MERELTEAFDSLHMSDRCADKIYHSMEQKSAHGIANRLFSGLPQPSVLHC